MKAFTYVLPGFCKLLLLFMIWKLTANSALHKDRVITVSALGVSERIILANQFILNPSTLKIGGSQRWEFVLKTFAFLQHFNFSLQLKIIGKMRKLSILPQSKEIGLEASVPQTERTGVKKRECKSWNLTQTPWPLNIWVFFSSSACGAPFCLLSVHQSFLLINLP